MKKILIIIPGMRFGGMERVAFIAREVLMKAGYDVSVLTLFSDEPDYHPDFKYDSIDCKIKNTFIGKVINALKRLYKLRKYKEKVKPDVVIAYGQGVNFYNAFSKKKEKLILGIRSYDWLYSYFLNYYIEKKIYKKGDVVVSVSKKIKNDAEVKFKIPKNKSFYLYNPYDVNYIRSKSFEYVDCPKNKKVLVSVGRLVDQKGFYHLIKAFSMLANNENIVLYIIGKGEREDDLKKLIKKLSLEENVKLLGGMYNPYKYMKIADLFVLPSITEGFPNVLVEAMALGRVVIAADCNSGPREILTDDYCEKKVGTIEYGDYGILTKPMTDSRNYKCDYIEECDKCLAVAIEKTLYNNELLVRYQKKARIRAEEFTYNVFEKKLLEIINQ